MLRSDYDILVNIYEQFNNSDLSEEDVSFLLGKPDVYFHNILDPTEKTRLKQEYVPLFVPILETSLENILPNRIHPDEEIKITAVSKFNKKSIVYRHTVTYADGTVSHEVEWKKRIVRGERKKENEALTVYLKQLIADHHFIVPRTALHLLIHLRDHFGQTFTVTDLKISLAKLIRSQGNKRPLLQRNNDDARLTYSENYYIEQTTDVTTVNKLFGVKSDEISPLSLYTIADLDKNILGFIGLDGRKLMVIHVLPQYQRIRLGTRMIDFTVALDKEKPLVADASVDSSILSFLEACGFKNTKMKYINVTGSGVIMFKRK